MNHVNLEMEFSKALDKLGDTTLQREDEEDDIGAAFQKFAVVTKELSALMKNMVSVETKIFDFETVMIKFILSLKSLQKVCLRKWGIEFGRFTTTFTILVVSKIVLRPASVKHQSSRNMFQQTIHKTNCLSPSLVV